MVCRIREEPLILTFKRQCYTPNANMADHSVGAPSSSIKARLVRPRCFILTVLLQKSLTSSLLFHYAYEVLSF